MLERTSTPISLPKKKRPASSWWVVLTGDGKAWRWTFRQVEPTGKRIHLPRLGGWHLWDLVTTFFRGNVWMNIFGFWPQVGGWQVQSHWRQRGRCLVQVDGSGSRYFIVTYIGLGFDPILYSLFGSSFATYKHITPLLYIYNYIYKLYTSIHHTCVYHVNKMYSTTVIFYHCKIRL